MDPIKYPKHGIPSRVMLINGENLLGIVYIKQNERIIDMLCDIRPFFPFLQTKGLTFLNKAAIIKVDIMESKELIGKEDLLPEFDRNHLERIERKAGGNPKLKSAA